MEKQQNKRNWPPWAKLSKKKKTLRLSCWNQEWNKGHYYWPYKNQKKSKEILWTTVCQQLDKSDETENFLERHKVLELSQKEIEKHEYTYNMQSNRKLPLKIKRSRTK